MILNILLLVGKKRELLEKFEKLMEPLSILNPVKFIKCVSSQLVFNKLGKCLPEGYVTYWIRLFEQINAVFLMVWSEKSCIRIMKCLIKKWRFMSSVWNLLNQNLWGGLRIHFEKKISR